MRRALPLAALAALAIGLAGAAQAKGPTSVRIDGPGLSKPVRLSGSVEGGPTNTRFFRFVQDVGFFDLAFCCPQPSRLLPGRPHGKLGTAYTLAFAVPGPEPEPDRVTATVYPYAADGVVIHMPAGQSIIGGLTHGGWLRAPRGTRATLAKLGIPATPPRRSGLPAGAWAGIGAGAALVLLGGTVLTRRPRRGNPGAA